MLDNEKLLFDELYEKTKDCGRVQFVELLMTKERENKELKLQLKGTTHCFDEEEHEKLKKQLEEKENIACNWKDSCLENAGKIEKLENQQKEFINYLEDLIKFYKNRDSYMVADILGSYDLNNIELELLEEILQKYKSIIGSKE